MKKATAGVVIIVVMGGLLAALYYRYLRQPESLPVPAVQRYPVSEKAERPEARYPVPEIQTQAPVEEKSPEAEPAKSLPAQGEDIQSIQEGLAWLFEGFELDELLVQENFVQRFVLMVDNLPRGSLSISHLPTRPALGRFKVDEEDGSFFISTANYERYKPYIRLAETLDTKKAVALYARFYPLFQKAYTDMGYRGYFNDRLIWVIGHLLAAPAIKGTVRLEPHIVRYRYADPKLEGLSAGHKIMIRIGNDNAEVVKAKLRELREELTRGGSNE